MLEFKNHAGRKYGKWLVQFRVSDHVMPSGQRQARWRCVCLGCGVRREVLIATLVGGRSTQCKRCSGKKASRMISVLLPSGDTVAEVARRHRLKLDTVYHRWIRGWPEAHLGLPARR